MATDYNQELHTRDSMETWWNSVSAMIWHRSGHGLAGGAGDTADGCKRIQAASSSTSVVSNNLLIVCIRWETARPSLAARLPRVELRHWNWKSANHALRGLLCAASTRNNDHNNDDDDNDDGSYWWVVAASRTHLQRTLDSTNVARWCWASGVASVHRRRRDKVGPYGSLTASSVAFRRCKTFLHVPSLCH